MCMADRFATPTAVVIASGINKEMKKLVPEDMLVLSGPVRGKWMMGLPIVDMLMANRLILERYIALVNRYK